MATYKRNKSGGIQSEAASNSASPASSVALSNPSSSQGVNNNAPKYGTLVPNRIFVGGISSNTSEAELCQLFSKYGTVKATKIIADRAGVSKGYGFVTFDSEEDAKSLINDQNNVVLKERRLNIAQAIKKQPNSRSFDTASPPPTTQNYFFHNGVPYTFHNGMAFFTPTAHQSTLAALPPSAEPHMYPSYGPAQNPAPAPYGTPVLVPAPPPLFMPQNYSYQPMPMTNGAANPYMYSGSGSSNSSSGSPMGGTPDNSHLTPTVPPQFYAQQYPTQEAYYPHPIYISCYYNNAPEFESMEQQATNDDCSSTVSTPRSDVSDRSINRSPRVQSQLIVKSVECNGQNSELTGTEGRGTQSNRDSQVPVVSWQNLKNHAEERELHVRDGRRAFHPIVPPPPPPQPPQMMLCQQPPYHNNYPSPVNNTVYDQYKQKPIPDSARGQRQNVRGGRSKYIVPANNIPFIPKFPSSFNNNNPFVINNNFYEKKPIDVNNVRAQRYGNTRGRNCRGNHHDSPPPLSRPKPSCSYLSSVSPQIMPQPQSQHYDRQIGAVDRPVMTNNSTSRWSTTNPSATSHQIKRFVCSKRQNGSTPNLGVTSNSANAANGRFTKRFQGNQDGLEGDMGGGGDTQSLVQISQTPANIDNCPEITSKVQSLSLGSSS